MATRDATSITEDLIAGAVFSSTIDSTIGYLHIDQSKTTALRSGGVNISNFTDDFDGDVRFGNPNYTGNGSAPDIGADEFAGLQFLPFSGIYNVGTGQNYTSLTNSDGIFSKINSLGFSGNVTIKIVSDLSETGAEALNQWSETGSGNYNLIIQPDATTLRLISGDVLAGMIRLNGADRVKIDGGGGRYLTFRNTNTAGTTGTAFTYINGATYDTIRNCKLEAFANANNAVVLFSTTVSAIGNSNNLLEYNNINGTVSSNISSAAIYSAGTAGKENAANTISNNKIYDYRDRAIDITATGSTGWIIDSNSFYNGDVTAIVNYAASSALNGIRILGGTGYNILNNFIGGNAALATGTNAVYSSSLGNISFAGISLTTTSATPISNIKGNTIAKISLITLPLSPALVAFTGIETNGSGINIGGSSPGDRNLVGSNSTNGSVTITTSTTSTSYTTLVRGIRCLSTGGKVTGNQVSGFDISNNGTAPAASAFSGIFINSATAPAEVDSNIIGSAGQGAVANSIRVLAGSTALATTLSGIELGSLVASAIQVKGNTIQNIANLSTTSSGNFTGINNTSTASGAAVTISNNLIKNISSAANSNINSAIYTGINSGSPSVISNDTISNINYAATGTAAQIRGIHVSGSFIQSVSGNFLSDFSTASTKSADVETGSPSGYTIVGILNSTSTAGQEIFGNTLSNFSTTTTSITNTALGGIGVATTGSSGKIYNNRIASFNNSATGISILPGIIGIIAANGSYTAYNNAVKLSNGVNSNGIKIYGVNHSTANSWNYYYNTISIGGLSSGNATRTAAIIRTINGTLFLRNNVLINTRTGTGSHYSISNKVATPATNWSSLASNYNDLYSSNANTIGEWGNGVNNTFAQWKSSSGGDNNSISLPVNFIASSYDLEPANSSNCYLDNSGTAITTPVGIGTAINNVSRNITSPDMGAYEFGYIFSIATWSGAVSTDWNTASNWQCGGIPTSTINTTIPGSLINYPTLSSGTGFVNNLTILSGASITITGDTLKIAGLISNSGTFNAVNGTVELNGLSAQNIPAGTFANNTILNLIISNDVALAGEDSLTGVLSFGANNKIFNTGGFLTLKSSANGTARVAEVNSGNMVTGAVKIERYISARRAWRLLTSPVNASGSQTIHNAWQEGVNNTTIDYQENLNPVPGYGTHITKGNDFNSGFDVGTNASSGIKGYNSSTGAWDNLPSTNIPITNYPAYMVFVRGGRSIRLSQGVSAASTPTILRSTGVLKSGNQSFPVAATGFTVVSNPYASPMDLNNIAKGNSSNIQDNFYLWDPKIAGAGGVGGFVNFSWNGNSYDITPITGDGISQFISSGFGFLAKSADGVNPGMLVVKEADKTPLNSDNVNRPKAAFVGGKLATSLYSLNVDGTTSLVDGVLNSFADAYSNTVDQNDAVKLDNFSENLSTLRDGKSLTVERRQVIKPTDTIFFNMLQLKARSYSFEFVANNLSTNFLTCFLEDSYLNTRTPISLDGTTKFNFNISNLPDSWKPNRFRVVFSPSEVLETNLVSVKAFQQNNDIEVQWKVDKEIDVKDYQIERSNDGIRFLKSAIVSPKHNNGSFAKYNSLDQNPAAGIHFYRIRSTAVNGQITYSAVIKVVMTKNDQSIVLNTNVVTNGAIIFQFVNMPKGIYSIKLLNNLGQLLYLKQLAHPAGTSTETIILNSLLAKGIYMLEFITAGRTRIMKKVFIR